MACRSVQRKSHEWRLGFQLVNASMNLLTGDLNLILHQWKRLAVGLLIVTSLALALHQSLRFFRYFNWEKALRISVSRYEGWPKWDLSRSDKLYIDGGANQGDENAVSDWSEAVQEFPDDPAIYWLHVTSGQWPEDYRETVDRVAPRNGFFDFLEAQQLSRKAFSRKSVRVEKPESDSAGSNGRRRWSYQMVDVVDEEVISRVIRLLNEGVRKPRFHQYTWEYRKEVLKRMPSHHDWVTQRAEGVGTWFRGSAWIFGEEIERVIRHRATQAVEAEDRRSFQDAVILSQRTAERIVGSSPHYFLKLRGLRILLESAIFYQKGARTLGLSRLAGILRQRVEILDRFPRKSLYGAVEKSSGNPLDDLAYKALSIPYVGEHLEGEFGLYDFVPMNRTLAAHVAWQKVLQIFWPGLGLVLILTIYCYLNSSRAETVSGILMRSVSCPKTILIGAILPLTVFMIIRYVMVSSGDFYDPG